MDLYVYYRVRAEDALRLQPQVEAMQRDESHTEDETEGQGRPGQREDGS